MTWIFLSPHLDDVALSCGGLVWEQTHQGFDVEIWTVCAGDPPKGVTSPFAQSLQARWELGNGAAAIRRQEDLAACAVLGARPRHLPVPDCIYRRSPETGEALYVSEQALFGALHPEDDNLISELTDFLARNLPSRAKLVCPLSIGSHVDHQLTRAAVEKLGRRLWYYADYPYVEKQTPKGSGLLPPGSKKEVSPVSEAGVSAWVQAVTAYRSQISTFWQSLAAMETAVRNYWFRNGGVILWHAGGSSEHNP